MSPRALADKGTAVEFNRYQKSDLVAAIRLLMIIAALATTFGLFAGSSLYIREHGAVIRVQVDPPTLAWLGKDVAIHWSADNVQEVTLDNQRVPAHGQQVAGRIPLRHGRHTLRVQFQNGNYYDYAFQLSVLDHLARSLLWAVGIVGAGSIVWIVLGRGRWPSKNHDTQYEPQGATDEGMVAPGKHTYMPQLDTLRAWALLSVFVSHFLGDNLGWFTALHWGRFGVLHFFVLSGFLITLILLTTRETAPDDAPRLAIARNFYVRRFLRIFPIYYLTIFAGYLLGYAPIRENLVWLLTYTMNMNSVGFLGPIGDYRYASHLWSLSVEEQFYLFWPFVTLFVPRRHLPKLLLALIMLGMGYKYAGTAWYGLSWAANSFVLPGCLDSLGLGALLAYYFVYRHEHRLEYRNLLRLGLLLGVPLFVGLQGYRVLMDGAGKTALYRMFIDLSIGLPSLALIHGATENGRNLVGRLLAFKPFQYIGRISYGGYLYHYLLLAVPITLPDHFLIRALIYTVAALAIASLSWYCIERPINRLKDRVPYFKSRPDLSEPAVVSSSPG